MQGETIRQDAGFADERNIVSREAILAEIIALTQPRTRADCPSPNFTVNEYAEQARLKNRDLALKRLRKAQAEGLLEGEKVLVDGNECWVFWKV
uniref:Uncharacterized protein n=1 Tax=viral metagenome TaxID=1070528 RepID=A0A6M3KRF4_9ZZZZ